MTRGEDDAAVNETTAISFANKSRHGRRTKPCSIDSFTIVQLIFDEMTHLSIPSWPTINFDTYEISINII